MSENVREIGADQFDEEVLKSAGPVIVDFWAPWCGPCKMVAPEVEKMAVAHGDKAHFFKVNVDEAGEIAMRYSIMSIPTLAKFEDGRLVAQIVGARGADAMAREFGLT
ncbi:MAG: thioredoxin [Coriobacteriia bacterium]|nr:thioredoxin [Coriobacteriia bacterium]